MKRFILDFFTALVLLGVLLLIFMPYFTSNFLDLRAQKEAEESYQKSLREKEAARVAQENAAKRVYLMGDFDPAAQGDFVEVERLYRLTPVKIYLRKEAYRVFLEMRKAAARDGLVLNIASATRNFNYQRSIWNNKWTGVTLVEGQNLSKTIPDGKERFKKILEYSAAPGTSRHHWGTDIDINDANPEYFETEKGSREYEWLTANAPLFGFCQTYTPKGPTRPMGYGEEKWHWTYTPLSRDLTSKYKKVVKPENIKGFLGDEYASDIDLINDYVLGINPECL